MKEIIFSSYERVSGFVARKVVRAAVKKGDSKNIDFKWNIGDVLKLKLKEEDKTKIISGQIFHAKMDNDYTALLVLKYNNFGTDETVVLNLGSNKYRDRTFSIPENSSKLEIYCLSKRNKGANLEVSVRTTQPIYRIFAEDVFGQEGYKVRLLPADIRKANEVALNHALRSGHVGWSKESEKQLLVNITIDVEDKDFKDGCLIQDDFNRWPGVLEAAYLMRSLGVPGTFFVNVYEALERSLEEKVNKICQELVFLGHEVALHTHPSKHLSWYNRELPYYSLEKQIVILDKGKKALEDWTGNEVKSYRAGGYRYNKDTIDALEKVGIVIDSSFLYGFVEESLDLSEYVIPQRLGAVFEAPVTPLAVSGIDGIVRAKKADLNWLTEKEHDKIINDFSSNGRGYLNYMLHSFSFCDRRRLGKWGDNKDESVLNGSMCHNDVSDGKRRIVVFGCKDEELRKFANFLLGLKDTGAKFKTVRESKKDFERLSESGEFGLASLPLIIN